MAALTTNPFQRQLQLATPDAHGTGLHPGQRHGTVLTWNKLARANAWKKIKPSDDLGRELSKHAGQKDRFLTVNQFHGWRIVRLLSRLQCCYVDIDFITRDEVMLALEDALIPQPNYLIESGNGVHLYWLLEGVPAQALPVWQAIQSAIFHALSARGIRPDNRAKDCARVLRLVGSRNSKGGGEVVGWIFHENRWNFRAFSNEVLGFRKAPPTHRNRPTSLERRRADNAVRRATGPFQLWHSRYRDLVAIADHHAFMSPVGIQDGHRHTMLFLMANALSWFTMPDRIEDEMTRVARTFAPTLKQSEVAAMAKTITKRAELAHAGETIQFNGRTFDPRYHFKTSTLREWIGPELLTDELEPQLLVLCSPERLAERDKARRKKRDSSHRADRYARTQAQRQAETESRRMRAQKLRGEGMKQAAIARELGVSQQTVSKLLKNTTARPL